MARNNDTAKLSLRFENDEAGRMKFVLTHEGKESSGRYEKEHFCKLVNSLVLSAKERAALLYYAANYCVDKEERKWLMDKAKEFANDASKIENDCARNNIDLAQISAANVSGARFAPTASFVGSRGSPPLMANAFVPIKSFEINEQRKEELVKALEGRFVDYYQGELALTALGLLDGQLLSYVTWIDKMYTLTTIVQFLLGLKPLPLLKDTIMCGFLLPAGMYGNKNKLVNLRGGGGNHWKVVAATFRNPEGGEYKQESLRATAARSPEAHQVEVSEVLYIFRHLIFEPDSNRPLNNGLYYGF